MKKQSLSAAAVLAIFVSGACSPRSEPTQADGGQEDNTAGETQNTSSNDDTNEDSLTDGGSDTPNDDSGTTAQHDVDAGDETADVSATESPTDGGENTTSAQEDAGETASDIDAGGDNTSTEADGGDNTADVTIDDTVVDVDLPTSCSLENIVSTACTDDCPLALDVRVSCDDIYSFGTNPPHVALNDNVTWLSLPRPEDDKTAVVEFHGGAATMLPAAPEGIAGKVEAIRADSQGHLHIVDQVSYFGGGDLTRARWDGESWTSSAFGDVDPKVIEIDANNLPVMLRRDGPNYGHQMVTESDGELSYDTLNLPESHSPYLQLTTTPQGEPLVFGRVYFDGDPFYALIHDDGEATPIGGEVDTWYGQTAHPAAPALPHNDDIDVADWVVAAQTDDALQLHWSTGETHQVPNSDRLVEGCGSNWEECPETCTDTGSGVLSGNFAATRTVDGAVWLAWVETNLDRQFSNELVYVEDLGNECQATLDVENSTARLKVARLSSAEADIDVLVDVDIRLIVANQLHIRAFENDVGIAAVVGTGYDDTDVRLLRVAGE